MTHYYKYDDYITMLYTTTAGNTPKYHTYTQAREQLINSPWKNLLQFHLEHFSRHNTPLAIVGGMR